MARRAATGGQYHVAGSGGLFRNAVFLAVGLWVLSNGELVPYGPNPHDGMGGAAFHLP